MAFTNAQTTNLIGAAQAGGKVDNAVVAFHKRIDALRDCGFKPEWLETKSDRIAEVRDIVAEQCLNAKELKVWRDTSLARKMKIGDKYVPTDRETYIKRVDKRISDIRKALLEPAKTGAKQPGSARELAKRITIEIEKLRKATVKDGGSDSPALGCVHKELIAAFDRVTDLVK